MKICQSNYEANYSFNKQTKHNKTTMFFTLFQMMNSLMSIRSSASKKKEKIIEKQSSSTLTSRSPSPDTLKESGVWSNFSGSDSDPGKKKAWVNTL